MAAIGPSVLGQRRILSAGSSDILAASENAHCRQVAWPDLAMSLVLAELHPGTLARHPNCSPVSLTTSIAATFLCMSCPYSHMQLASRIHALSVLHFRPKEASGDHLLIVLMGIWKTPDGLVNFL